MKSIVWNESNDSKFRILNNPQILIKKHFSKPLFKGFSCSYWIYMLLRFVIVNEGKLTYYYNEL